MQVCGIWTTASPSPPSPSPSPFCVSGTPVQASVDEDTAPSPASQLMSAVSFQEAQHFLSFNPSYMLQRLDSRQVWPRVWGSVLPPRPPQTGVLLKDGTLHAPGPTHRAEGQCQEGQFGKPESYCPQPASSSKSKGGVPVPPSPHDPDRNHTTQMCWKCISTFIATLFITASTWEQPRCPSHQASLSLKCCSPYGQIWTQLGNWTTTTITRCPLVGEWINCSTSRQWNMIQHKKKWAIKSWEACSVAESAYY